MIAVYLGTALTGLVSAFFPVTPVEPYLLAIAAATGYGAVGLGVAAAGGQTLGKTLIFLGARGAFRSKRLREFLDRVAHRRKRRPRAESPFRLRMRRMVRPLKIAAKRLTESLERPALTLPILFLSASVGIPPLLATCVYIAGTRIRTPVFVVVCFAGRAVRFIAIAYAPYLVLG